MPPKAKKQSAPPSPDISGLVEFAAFHNHPGLIEGRTNPRFISCNCSNPSAILLMSLQPFSDNYCIFLIILLITDYLLIEIRLI